MEPTIDEIFEKHLTHLLKDCKKQNISHDEVLTELLIFSIGFAHAHLNHYFWDAELLERVREIVNQTEKTA